MDVENNTIERLLIFTAAFAFFQTMPAFLPGIFKGPVTWGDALDFLTPFVVIPVAYGLFKLAMAPKNDLSGQPRFQDWILKGILGSGFILYIDGHGLHLSANAISRLMQSIKGSKSNRRPTCSTRSSAITCGMEV